MSEKDRTECPECGLSLQKLISGGGAIVIGNREANQFKDIQKAKYWRDKNGVRHRVTGADGHTTSATVTQQTATPAEIKANIKKDRKAGRKERLNLQKRRADAWNRQHK